MRKLQRDTVNIPQRAAQRLAAQGEVKEIVPGLFAQDSDMLYHPEPG